MAPERITSAYNSCLHAAWTPTVQPEDIPAESSFRELLEEENEHDFWRQPPPTESRAFMSSIWKGMKKIWKGQIQLEKQMEEQSARLERIEQGLRRSRSAGPSNSAGSSCRRGWHLFHLSYFMHSYHIAYIEDNAWDRCGERVLT